jgi:hypothetical protein
LDMVKIPVPINFFVIFPAVHNNFFAFNVVNVRIT